MYSLKQGSLFGPEPVLWPSVDLASKYTVLPKCNVALVSMYAIKNLQKWV